MEDYLNHTGTPHEGWIPHSGRYPWGSGDNPQRNKVFGHYYKEMKDKGASDADIAKAWDTTIEDVYSMCRDYIFAQRHNGKSDTDIAYSLGLSTNQYRIMNSVCKDLEIKENAARAQALYSQGWSKVAIAKELGVSDGTVGNYIRGDYANRKSKTEVCVEALRNELETKKYLDVGLGTEYELGVTDSVKKAALKKLEDEGYKVFQIKVAQATNPDKKTTVTVLAQEDATYGDIIKNLQDVKPITNYIADDNGKLGFSSVQYPVSIDSSRVFIRYKEDGGSEKDGVVELRRGVEDLDLGNSLYAQVRIAVDDSFYMKGMALYSDDVPEGYDVIYNTNKKRGTMVMNPDPDGKTVMKPMKRDKDGNINQDLPFGSVISAKGQSYYIDSKTGERKLSAINKLNEEGDWGEWSKTISAQVLSKQPVSVIDKQLKMSIMSKEAEFEEIKNLTNPTVKRKLLESFADDCDANAVDLKAIAFPKQATRVILPCSTLKENECYIPNIKGVKEGDQVALIRYPHQGTFEIPILTVNKRNPEAKSIISPLAKDAVGINPKTAQILSGADFDGDTVVVIPLSDKVKIQSTVGQNKAFKDLQDFEPKDEYPGYPGMKIISNSYKQKQMGIVTNLVTDMTLKGAPPEDIAKAVRHAQVIIDAEKHALDWKRSEKDNDIEALKNKYQYKPDGTHGVSTLISASKSIERVPMRKQWNINTGTDKETGEKVYKLEPGYISRKTGEMVYKTEEVPKMSLTNDARTLISEANTPQERLYANYANKLKALANEARKEYFVTPKLQKSPSSAKAYSEEVNELETALIRALKNSPKERLAQMMANVKLEAVRKANPEMKRGSKEEKKYGQQILGRTRAQIGAKKDKVEITPRQWEAIQAGAISDSKLMDILNNTDMDKVRELATPKASNALSAAQQARLRAYANNGHTLDEIADYLNVSVSTVSKYLNQ